MFKAYVAALLNLYIGNCPVYCDDPVWGGIDLFEADAWFDFIPGGTANYWGIKVKARSELWQESHGEAIYWCLDDYNNGLLEGIPSRDTLE